MCAEVLQYLCVLPSVALGYQLFWEVRKTFALRSFFRDLQLWSYGTRFPLSVAWRQTRHPWAVGYLTTFSSAHRCQLSVPFAFVPCFQYPCFPTWTEQPLSISPSRHQLFVMKKRSARLPAPFQQAVNLSWSRSSSPGPGCLSLDTFLCISNRCTVMI